MIISIEDLDKANKLFHSDNDLLLEPYACEMNKKHKIISLLFKEFEKRGIDGIIIDELMISVLAIWYVIEKHKYKRISEITEIDLTKNYELFNSFIEYFNNSDYDEKKILNFLPYEKELGDYAVLTLKSIYKDLESIPKELFLLYFSLIKCFEDKLEYTRK